MGFLHSKPDDWSSSRAALYAKEGIASGLPDIDAGEHYLEWLAQDLGWCDQDGMGNMRAHSWLEIDAMDRQLGLNLEPDEARMIRAMSNAYIEGHHHGREAMALAPAYDDRDEDPGIALERRLVSEKIKAGMGGKKKPTT